MGPGEKLVAPPTAGAEPPTAGAFAAGDAAFALLFLPQTAGAADGETTPPTAGPGGSPGGSLAGNRWQRQRLELMPLVMPHWRNYCCCRQRLQLPTAMPRRQRLALAGALAGALVGRRWNRQRLVLNRQRLELRPLVMPRRRHY